MALGRKRSPVHLGFTGVSRLLPDDSLLCALLLYVVFFLCRVRFSYLGCRGFYKGTQSPTQKLNFRLAGTGIQGSETNISNIDA
ncbi:hypothetical protein VN97_g6955 [Penicillium thymicola]|uniref:Uncharacterized protein n=1 Tax=Penicillium thymicola TaxID=293382 RepID=A0AAI9X758_PENTH|nr:hypothetical protein VN97_g6955 [Penicillium thymicola]